MVNEKFIKAEEYKIFCTISGPKLDKRDRNFVGEYEVIDLIDDKRTNCRAIAYKKDNEIVICYLGTEALSAKDHRANLQIAFSGKPNDQMKKADEFCKTISEDYRYKNCKISAIGQSEGGSEATYVGLKNNLETTTFNAYGLSEEIINTIKQDNGFIDTSLVTNFRDPNDPVSKLQENIGETYIIPNPQNPVMSKTPFGWIPSHRTKNLGSCLDAVSVEDYKRQNPNFIDKIKDVKMTNEDIGEFSPELFSFYENEIDNRMKKGEIISDTQASNAARTGDLIHINSYTRADGTEVKGHYRHI